MIRLRSHSVRVRCLALVVAVSTVFGAPRTGAAATLPAGFTETVFGSGLSSPTAMQFAPDGRLFVAQQGGALRVIQGGVLLPTPFVTLSVDANGERGLLGVAFDPNFAANQYVYVYYTVPGGSGVSVHNRVSRFTANGNVALAGSELPIVDLDNLTTATNHNGGAIDFGPDGKLYIAVGDNATSSNAQTLGNRHGKMLRYNADGSIPTDNPFYSTASGQNRSIWALGLRNPFTFAQNPGGTPAMFINDVGQGTAEEVNPGAAGANFGWPTTSDGDFDPASQPALTRPRFAYANDSSTCAITGGAFYNAGTPTFPAQFQGMYFYADFCANWIRVIDPTIVRPWTTPIPTPFQTPVTFATGVNGPVDLKVGSDGALYYLARGSGAVYRVQYGSSAPGITTHPANRTVAVGQSAMFSVVASGTGPFTYQWQRNNANINGATGVSYTLNNAQLSDTGARFRVNVANSVGNLYSNEATLTVTTNVPPVATITAPTTALRYTGGMSIAFSGTGSDPDGPASMPASAFTWRIDFHHDTHAHPFLPSTSGVTSGTFVVPTTGETSANVWYRIYLTVTDSGGLSHTVQRDVLPRVVRLTLATSPAALQVRLDGQPVSTPASFDSVVGMQRTLEAPEQTVAGTTYAFTGWSDGGAASRAILTPPVATTYTASFTAMTVTGVPAAPTALAAIVNGGTVRLSWNRSAGGQRYRLEAGTASGLADLVNVDMGDVTSFEGLVPPGTYFVRVRAVNTAGASGPSSQVTVTVTSTASCLTPPPTPGGFTAQTGGLLAALSWNVAAAATTYALDVGRASGVVELSLPLGAATAFQAVAPAGTYFTRVRALNACGASAPSAEVPLTLACGPGAVVPGMLAVTSAGGVATFSWQAPLGATGYRMRVGTVQGASDVADIPIGSVTAIAVPLGGVPPRTYYVRVVAESACGIGNASNEVTLQVP